MNSSHRLWLGFLWMWRHWTAGCSPFPSTTLCGRYFSVWGKKKKKKLRNVFIMLRGLHPSQIKWNSWYSDVFLEYLYYLTLSLICYNAPALHTRKWCQEKECRCPTTSPPKETSSLPLTSTFLRSWPLRASSWSNKPFLLDMKHDFKV